MKPPILRSLYKPARLLRGFTLIELMVTIAVMVILASLAAPALGTFVSRSTMRGMSADFNLAFQRARSEAINRNECVAICMSDNASSATPSCSASGSNWAVGWIVFRYPACTPTSGVAFTTPSSENMVLAREGVTVRYRLNNIGGIDSVVFNARGVPRSGASKFNLLDNQAVANGPDDKFNRTFCLDFAGRLRTVEYLASCT